MGHQVEHRGRIAADADADEHVADLAHRRVGDDPLEVGDDDRDRAGDQQGGDADPSGDVGRGRGEFEEHVRAGDQVDAGRDHGGGVDQRGDRGRAFHRVGQPCVERHLGRLGECADQQEQADRDDRPFVGGEDVRGLLEDGAVVDGADLAEDEDCRQDEADVSDHVDNEGLHAGLGGGDAAVPVADQGVRGEADEGPADDQQDEVAGQDQQQHREDEEVEVAEEAVVSLVRLHVGIRIDVDQRRDAGHDQHHHHRERIDVDAEVDLEAADVCVLPEAGSRDPRVGRFTLESDEGGDAAAERGHDRSDADRSGHLRWDQLEAQADNDRAEQREEQDEPPPGCCAHP